MTTATFGRELKCPSGHMLECLLTSGESWFFYQIHRKEDFHEFAANPRKRNTCGVCVLTTFLACHVQKRTSLDSEEFCDSHLIDVTDFDEDTTNGQSIKLVQIDESATASMRRFSRQRYFFERSDCRSEMQFLS
jgi:hypothetical protein